MLPVAMENILTQAKQTQTAGSAALVSLDATIITPSAHYSVIGVEGLLYWSNFVNEHADIITITVRIQPGLFMNKILPYKDNLTLELIVDIRLHRLAPSSKY